jgi:hypothetical protein
MLNALQAGRREDVLAEQRRERHRADAEAGLLEKVTAGNIAELF